MAEPKDPKNIKEILSTKDIDEFRSAILGVFNEIRDKSGAITDDFKTGFSEVLNILNDANTDKFNINLDNIQDYKDILNEIVKTTLQEKDLTEEKQLVLTQIALMNEAAEKAGMKGVLLEENINDELRKRVGLADIYESKSLLITRYELQQLKAYGDMMSPMQKRKEIQEDLAKLTQQQAAWYIKGTVVKGALNIADSFMKQIGALSTIKADLNKLTTDTETYLDNIRVAAKEVSGLTFEEAAATTKELINGMSQFTKLTEETRTELLKTVAVMDKLGLSTQNQVILLQMTTKSFGMSVAQAQSSLTRLQSFAESTGIPMSELNKNLGAVGNKLAAFGPAGYDKVFQSLSVAAKNLGIEMNKLLSITEGFTTFEGAAQAAGQLNAVLGGNFINSIKLLDASMNNPIEAFAQIKEGLDASGKSFRDMSLPMQRYIASILNMDVAEAQALFGQSLGAATSQMRAQAKQQEELNALAAKSTDAFKRLEIAFQKIIASPVSQALISIIEGFVGIIEFALQLPILGDGITAIASTVAVLAIGMVTMNSVIATSTMMWTLLTKAIGINRTASILNFLASNKWLGNLGTWIAGKLLKISILAREGEQELITAGKKAAARQIEAGGIASMGAILSTLGPLTPILWAVAGVILAIGAAVALTGLGVKFMAEGFAELVPVMVEAGVEGYGTIGMMLLMTFAIFQLIGSLAAAIPIVTGAAPVILALGAAFALAAIGLGAYMALQALSIQLETDQINAKKELKQQEKEYAEQVNKTFGSLMEFAKILEKLETYDPFTFFASGIAQISQEIDKLDTEKLSLLSSIVSPSVSPASPAGIAAEENKVMPVKVVEIEAKQEIKKTVTDSNVPERQASLPQINLSIDSPVMLGTTQFGRMIYNGIVKYEQQKEAQQTLLGKTNFYDDEGLLEGN